MHANTKNTNTFFTHKKKKKDTDHPSHPNGNTKKSYLVVYTYMKVFEKEKKKIEKVAADIVILAESLAPLRGPDNCWPGNNTQQ